MENAELEGEGHSPSRCEDGGAELVVGSWPFCRGTPESHETARSRRAQGFDPIVVFRAPDGSVRVLNLRHTVGEVAALRSPQRRVVQGMQLSADGEELRVQGDDADYRYDAHSLRLISREARFEAGLALASAPTAAGRH